MADETAPVPVKIVEDVAPESTEDALKIVLRKSLEVNGLVRGLSEVARALDRQTAHLCILASDCNEPAYCKLIQALCKVNEIDIIMVEKAKLAEWAGLVKYDAEGNIKKTFKCSSVAVRDFGERTKALELLLSQLQ
eukprot:Tbor_TRINITY_DN5424_c2_g1::TRINITY_DN5424_c2_g1_i1::g.24528::m.24528/K02951/RP-S12e, RPS12; small subunit ribosomal protein S12e